MMINKISSAPSDDKKAKEALSALGLSDKYASPAWPLPHMKPSSENVFWGWRACWTFPMEIWVGQIKINGEWANLMIYYVGHSHFIDGGFAVAVFRQYQKERVEYFEWRACDHEFSSRNTGNFLNEYTCKKCGKSFEVDSSG